MPLSKLCVDGAQVLSVCHFIGLIWGLLMAQLLVVHVPPSGLRMDIWVRNVTRDAEAARLSVGLDYVSREDSGERHDVGAAFYAICNLTQSRLV